jgi:hypothetical protein
MMIVQGIVYRASWLLLQLIKTRIGLDVGCLPKFFSVAGSLVQDTWEFVRCEFPGVIILSIQLPGLLTLLFLACASYGTQRRLLIGAITLTLHDNRRVFVT